MLPVLQQGKEGPLIVLLHWLGGGARSWDRVGELLASGGTRVAALDLPGFGDAADRTEFGIAAAVAETIATIRVLRTASTEPWLLCGHSMGGKLAMIVARAAAEGAEGLEGLSGLVLISPSPVSPEPMQESKREDLLRTMGAGDAPEESARFVEDNTVKLALEEAVRDEALAVLARRSYAAFVAWLTTGSREDWSDRVGVLPLPALVLAGSEEADLGPKAQRELTLSHLPAGVLAELAGAGHLSPLERPAEVADRILAFAQTVGLPPASPRGLREGFRVLLESNYTSPRTRAVMEARLHPDAGGPLDAEEMLTLRALVRRVVPGAGFDLAARLNRKLLSSDADGWRFADLPPDALAWKTGLASLERAALREHGVPFVGLDAGRQDALLTHAREGKLGKGILGTLTGAETFDAGRMKQWFEDVRGELAKLYIADPRTMQRIGFEGFADDHGFTHIQLGDLERLER